MYVTYVMYVMYAMHNVYVMCVLYVMYGATRSDADLQGKGCMPEIHASEITDNPFECFQSTKAGTSQWTLTSISCIIQWMFTCVSSGVQYSHTRVELSGRLPIKLYGHENSHPLELRVCLSQTL